MAHCIAVAPALSAHGTGTYIEKGNNNEYPFGLGTGP